MAHERLRPEFTFDEAKIEQLKQLAPECFEDGKINFETLRQNLGDWAQDEDDAELEHFGLFWPGKREARRIAAIPPEGTLEPVFGEGLKADGTPDTDGQNDSRNIFIEGENLEVFKILQKSYANKIKMIYIDPPYNTGNDFVYDDDFTEPLQEYLRRTGQVDEEGKPLTTNKRSDGRFHSKWLSMMYPRLRLARNLLREDGVIFVSIDDNEVHNLRAIMNEIFGEENFIANIIWEKNYAPSNDSKWFSANHDHIVIYSKDKETWRPNLLPRTEELLSRYKNPDNDLRGPWQSDNMTVKTYSKDYDYEITSPTGKKTSPTNGRCWFTSKIRMQELIRDNRVWFGEDGNNTPRIKRFLSEVKDGVTPLTICLSKNGKISKALILPGLENKLDLFNQSPLRDDWNKNKLLN
jgi:adenine-specific DNA-methyltransferase